MCRSQGDGQDSSSVISCWAVHGKVNAAEVREEARNRKEAWGEQIQLPAGEEVLLDMEAGSPRSQGGPVPAAG